MQYSTFHDPFPVVVKLTPSMTLVSGFVSGLDVLPSLKKICPHLVNVLCHYQKIPELYKDALVERQSIKLNQLQHQLLQQAPSTENDLKKKEIMMKLKWLSTISHDPALIVMERVVSPTTFAILKRTSMSPSMLISLTFQLLWTVNSFLTLGVSHGDFFSRNIWLQPIKSDYKYMFYTSSIPGMPSFYLPLSFSTHLIIKVGDYDMMTEYTGLQNAYFYIHNSIRQLSYEFDNLRNSCKDCKDMFENLSTCLSSVMETCTIPRPTSFNLSSLPIYHPIFEFMTHFPDDAKPEEIIYPRIYYDPIIVKQ